MNFAFEKLVNVGGVGVEWPGYFCLPEVICWHYNAQYIMVGPLGVDYVVRAEPSEWD